MERGTCLRGWTVCDAAVGQYLDWFVSKMSGAGWLGNCCNGHVPVYDCSRGWHLDMLPVDVFKLTERYSGDVVAKDQTVQDGSLLALCLIVDARAGCEESDAVSDGVFICPMHVWHSEHLWSMSHHSRHRLGFLHSMWFLLQRQVMVAVLHM